MQNPPYGRKKTINKVFQYLDNITDPYIFEVGMTRNLHKLAWMHDGYFTLIMAWYLNTMNKGRLTSVDIDPKAIDICVSLLAKYDIPLTRTELLCSDVFDLIKNISKPIDVLYLDAWDYTIDIPNLRISADININNSSEANHLKAFQMAEPLLKHNSLVIIDDILDNVTYYGKGRTLIPYMINNGYRILTESYACDSDVIERPIYQFILTKEI